MEVFRVACIFILLLFGSTSAEYKRWLPDTNFENPNNWNVKRAPCGNDVVIIPEDSPVVFVQINTTIKELILPKNGELVLARNLRLGFTETPEAGCLDASGDIEFTAIHPMAWLDPNNWCGAPTEQGTCDVSQGILDTDRIPCSYDDVIFPRQHLFFVDFSEDTPTLSAKSLKIGANTFTTDTFVSYLNSTDGARMFRLPGPGAAGGRLSITRKGCDLSSGCACGNDKPEIAKAICAHVEKRCARPRCSQTIQPVGSCCRLCGAIFNITRGYGFNLNGFTSTLRSKFLSDSAQSGVNMTSSLTSEEWVQVVLTDLTGDKSASIAKLMLADFNNDLASGGHRYAIDAVKLSLITDTPKPMHFTNTGEMTAGSIAGLVLGILTVIVIIIIVVIIFIFRRSGRTIPLPNMPNLHLPSVPNFPGFPRRTPMATARVMPGMFHQPHTASHIDPGFANPLYDSSPFDDGNTVMKEMELIATSVEEQPTFDISEGGFYNPMFVSSGASMFSDPVIAGQGPGNVNAASTSSTSIKIDNPNSKNGDSTI